MLSALTKSPLSRDSRRLGLKREPQVLSNKPGD
jgi:hypothetical protein